MPNLRKKIVDEGAGFLKDVIKLKPKVNVEMPTTGDLAERLEEIYATSPERQKKAPKIEKPMSTTTEGAETILQQENIATACIPCAIGHYGTCSGLLNEAMRFAKNEGIDSGEVIDRVNMCMDELNAMERVDLRPELIADLPRWEKELANKALTSSRSLRHGLESLRDADDLERVAATTQTIRNEIGREWFKRRLSKMSEAETVEKTEAPEELSLDEAKKLAAEEAEKEVEKLWQQSQEKQ